MSFRNLDGNHDWVFGSGLSDYVTGNQEVGLNIKTRILSFLGDCFFAPLEGIDWWHLLEYNKRDEIENAVMTTISKTPDVISVNEVESSLNARRQTTLSYDITSIFSSQLTDTIIPITGGFNG